MKKFLNNYFLWALFLLPALNSCSDKSIAHWDFNSAADSLVPDKAGSHNAMLTDKREARLFISPDNKALLFDWKRGILKVNHAEDLSLEDDFTIECIFKPTSFNSYHSILFKGDRHQGQNIVNYWLDFREGKLEFKSKTRDDAWHNWISLEPVIQLDKWHKVVLSYKSGNVKLWVNGNECKVSQPAPFEGGKLVKNNYPLLIGQGLSDRNDPRFPFVGLIDDIKIIKGAVETQGQGEKDKWEKQMVAFAKRERNDMVDNFISRIDSSRTKFSVPDADAGTLKAKVADVSKLPSDKLEQGFTDLEKEFNDILFKSYYKKYSKNADGFLVATLETARRIERREDFVNYLPPVTGQVKLEAAGNEYEGFQALMVSNPEKDVTGIKIGVSDLVHASGKGIIGSGNITYGRIRDIVSTKPDIDVDFIGAIPDEIEDDLAPQSVLRADFMPVYFRVNVPEGTPAGIYNGTVSFTGNGSTETINLQLRVFDFSLPKRSSLKMAFSFFEQFYRNWYDYKSLSDEQKMYIYDYLLKYRISPNNIYDTSATYPEIKYLDRLKDRINFFTFSTARPPAPLPEKDLEKLINDRESTFNQLKAKGLAQFAYFFSYSELLTFPKPLPGAKQFMPALRKRLPDLKTIQCSFPDLEIKDLFNVWCPLLFHFGYEDDLKFLRELKQRGDEIWWYTTDYPASPFPNYFLDYPVFNPRIISTLCFKYDIDGMLYWCINREWEINMDIRKQWPEASWKSHIINSINNRRVFKNGMGNLMYPGPSGKIYPSLRLENLRDGVEDYDYLVMLRNSIEGLKKVNQPGKEELIKEATSLLKVPAGVAVAVNNYSPDPDNLLKYRTAVAGMIEKIKNTGK